jgi:hypothetical protein
MELLNMNSAMCAPRINLQGAIQVAGAVAIVAIGVAIAYNVDFFPGLLASTALFLIALGDEGYVKYRFDFVRVSIVIALAATATFAWGTSGLNWAIVIGLFYGLWWATSRDADERRELRDWRRRR